MLIYEDSVLLTTGFKRCSKCGKYLPASREYFYYNGYYKNRHVFRGKCIKCRRKVTKRWRQDNDDYLRQYRKNNRGYMFNWRKNNRDRVYDVLYTWRANNPEKVRAYMANYQAKKVGNGGTHTDDDIKLQYRCQRGRCWYCQCELNGIYHVDHRMPISKGGHNGPGNLVISCPTCNLKKSDKMPWEEWEYSRLL